MTALLAEPATEYVYDLYLPEEVIAGLDIDDVGCDVIISDDPVVPASVLLGLAVGQVVEGIAYLSPLQARATAARLLVKADEAEKKATLLHTASLHVVEATR